MACPSIDRRMIYYGALTCHGPSMAIPNPLPVPPFRHSDWIAEVPLFSVHCFDVIRRCSSPPRQVCVGSFPIGAVKCKYGKYAVVRGDSCSSVIVKKFQGSVSLMTQYNPGFVCTNSALYVGLSLCLPP